MKSLVRVASRLGLTAAVFAALGLGALGACKGKSGPPASGTGPEVPGRPVETQPPNAPGQRPAFVGQTRAPYRTANVAFDAEVLARGLDHPWSVAFLPEGAMLVTERPGRLRIVGKDGEVSQPVANLPGVDARGQGGLLDVAVDPRFADNGMIYLSYAEAEDGTNGTALARARLVRDANPHLEDVTTIWKQTPTLDSTMHFGGRILFDRTGAILLTLGERSIEEGRMQAQRLDGTLGKIVRVMPDGSIPKDNPFVGKANVRPEIWSYGHRNIQAATWRPSTGQLVAIEHGTRGGDEINIVEPGKDYGWPTIAYGIEYQGGPIHAGITQRAGMEQPIYYWDPVIAPSGATFYDGDAFPAWRGSLLVGALAGKHVARLTFDGDRVVGEERLLVDRARFRDVRTGPDGLIYLLTDDDDGELLRLKPATRTATAR